MINKYVKKELEKLQKKFNFSFDDSTTKVTIGGKGNNNFKVGETYNVRLEHWMVSGDWCQSFSAKYNDGMHPMGKEIKGMRVIETSGKFIKVEGYTYGEHLWERAFFKGWIPVKAIKEVL